MKSLKQMENGVEQLTSVLLTLLICVIVFCGGVLALRFIIGFLITLSMG